MAKQPIRKDRFAFEEVNLNLKKSTIAGRTLNEAKRSQFDFTDENSYQIVERVLQWFKERGIQMGFPEDLKEELALKKKTRMLGELSLSRKPNGGCILSSESGLLAKRRQNIRPNVLALR